MAERPSAHVPAIARFCAKTIFSALLSKRGKINRLCIERGAKLRV
jgi:hypothetical protein